MPNKEKLIHPVSGEVKEITLLEMLGKMDRSVHPAIYQSLERYPDKEGLVLMENLQMDSSDFGHRTVLVVGPGNSWQLAKVTDAGFRLGDVPSRFLYPVAYVDYRTPADLKERIAEVEVILEDISHGKEVK